MEQNIHPEALKTFRKRRGWSQKELAEKCLCSSEQVSRWERGKSRRVQSNTRAKLSRALDVEWEELTRAPIGDPNLKEENSNLVQVNVRIDASLRNALQLVCLRYNVTPTEVIGIAPLLFLIIAEQSLAHRQKSLDEIDEKISQMKNEKSRVAPHLASDLVYRPGTLDNIIGSEQDSISRRDIFGDKVEYEHGTDEEDSNPFVNYLRLLAESIPKNLVPHLWAYWRHRVGYTLAPDTLREVTGISGETEYEKNILNQIEDGNIDLREALRAKEVLPPEEYLEHLNQLWERYRLKLAKYLPDLEI